MSEQTGDDPQGQAGAGRAGSDAAETTGADANALLSRLRLIEDQPLEARAEAFVQIHDELRSTLEAGDSAHG